MTVYGYRGQVVHHNDCTYCRHRIRVPRTKQKGAVEVELCGLTRQKLALPGTVQRFCEGYQQIDCECDQCIARIDTIDNRESMLRLSVTDAEVALLEDLEEVGFGELFNVFHEEGPKSRLVDVSDREVAFLKTLRKIKGFERVVVHDSEPASAEWQITTLNGRKALKKHKF